MAPVRTAAWLFAALHTLPPRVDADCTAETHHPLNNGYYIEGVAGIVGGSSHGIVSSGDLPVDEYGRRQDNTTWAPNTYYPHGELVKCTGIFCSDQCRDPGCAQYLPAHTCALLRFEFEAPSTVYMMPSVEDFTNCTFDNAVLLAAADATQPFDYAIEESVSEGTILYFASREGCVPGAGEGLKSQKVAVEVVGGYKFYYDWCFSIGAGNSRIPHCDCRQQIKPTSLVDPCLTGFVEGCLADMPDDLSCCPGEDIYYNTSKRDWENGGTCVPKSWKQDVLDTLAYCKNNQTACDVWSSGSCPPHGASPELEALRPLCFQWQAIQQCTGATDTEVLAACADNRRWTTYQAWLATSTTEAPETTAAMTTAAMTTAAMTTAAMTTAAMATTEAPSETTGAVTRDVTTPFLAALFTMLVAQ